jgi:hypothetical protein
VSWLSSRAPSRTSTTPGRCCSKRCGASRVVVGPLTLSPSQPNRIPVLFWGTLDPLRRRLALPFADPPWWVSTYCPWQVEDLSHQLRLLLKENLRLKHVSVVEATTGAAATPGGSFRAVEAMSPLVRPLCPCGGWVWVMDCWGRGRGGGGGGGLMVGLASACVSSFPFAATWS